jgi:plastocyanin
MAKETALLSLEPSNTHSEENHMPDWSIKIVSSDNCDGATFDPPVLNTQQDDLVSWNNTTKDTHQIGLPHDPLTGLAEDFVSDPIPANQSSRPGYDTAPQATPEDFPVTITYYCLIHPSERGTIIVSAVPT